MRNFIGKIAFVTVTDPWEFGTDHGCGPFRSTVVAQEGYSHLLVRLDAPLHWKDIDIVALAAEPRHAGVTFARLVYGADVSCAMIALPEAKLSAEPSSVATSDGPGLLGEIRFKGGVRNLLR